MKHISIIMGCLLSLSALADEPAYREPTKLNPTEIQKAETELINNHIKRSEHVRVRLAHAKQHAQKIAKSGVPLQRPYFGDMAGDNSAHQH